MTALDEVNDKKGLSSDISAVKSENPDIDKIMSEIDELQRQMAFITQAEPPSSFAKRRLALVEQTTSEDPALEATPSEDPALEKVKESSAQINASASSPPPLPAPSLPLVDKTSTAKRPHDAPQDLDQALDEVLNQSKAVDDVQKNSQEVNDFFKELEGGEVSLLEETLAGLPNHVVDPSPIEKQTGQTKGSHKPKTESEHLESESMLAAVLDPSASMRRRNFGADSAQKIDDAVQEILKTNESKAFENMGTRQKNSSSDNSLSMTVTGQMSLKLNFEYEGQEILVHFNTEVIHIQFSEGTEFKIPVKRRQSNKAA